jgi:hypothetical protein
LPKHRVIHQSLRLPSSMCLLEKSIFINEHASFLTTRRKQQQQRKCVGALIWL